MKWVCFYDLTPVSKSSIGEKMGNSLLNLVNSSDAEKKEKGTEYTPAEIFQQPEIRIQYVYKMIFLP